MTKDELDKLIESGKGLPGKPGRTIDGGVGNPNGINQYSKDKTENKNNKNIRFAPCGMTCAARMRWIAKHKPEVFDDFLNGKYTKIRVSDGELLYDLPAAEEAAGRRLSSKHVYVLEAIGSNRYKIGWGKNLAARIQKIKNASPFPVEIVAKIASNDPRKLESELHKLFDSTRVWREWFSLSAEQVDYLKSI